MSGPVYSIPKKYVPGKSLKATKPDTSIGKEVMVKKQTVLPNGLTLTVALGDLTCEKVDCIVNAANSKLAHGAGLAKAISMKGGPVIRKESGEYIAAHGPVATGQLAVTSAGNLPCKSVLHVVGPMYDNGKKGEDDLLRQAIRTTLKTTEGLKHSSLSVPALSSGLFGFPKDLCARILIDETIAFDTKMKGEGALKEVRFTNFDSDTVGYFERYFATLFESQG
eukprot:TRINITY_DN24227_c0_g1_i1.p2 TRINITY_DN24227_c0_g1~~TRINITY_DN24227_c0_g1_i1.p2  ORF type:complete len:223 (+),score=24.14 TRINITY_DN24227_c0_g1_i1:37-705(+)